MVDFEELILFVSPVRLPLRAGGVLGAQSPSNGVGSFSLERFLFVFRGEFSAGNRYPQARQQRIGAGIMTYSGREEERAP